MIFPAQALAESGGRTYVVRRPVNYDALVLTIDDYRRIAAGENPDTVRMDGMQERILKSINERYEKMMREANKKCAGGTRAVY